MTSHDAVANLITSIEYKRSHESYKFHDTGIKKGELKEIEKGKLTKKFAVMNNEEKTIIIEIRTFEEEMKTLNKMHDSGELNDADYDRAKKSALTRHGY